MFKLKPGWTKERVLEQFKKRNNGTKSINPGHYCMYRGANNNACAVGAFIPDDKYRFSMEWESVRDVIPEYNLEEFMPLSIDGMVKMQMYHDGCDFHHLEINTNGNTYKAIELFLEKEVE